MRRAHVFLGALALAYLVWVSQASAFGWRLHWRLASTGNSYVSCETAGGDFDGASQFVSRDARFATRDEQRVSELGPDRARMVYPSDGETSPYPACRGWKCVPDDYLGTDCGWDWSESNCPWKRRAFRWAEYRDDF